MATLLSRARRWWLGSDGTPAPVVPFEVSCACGQVAAGVRQDRHQIVPCPGCGQPLFVLPRSAYPAPEQYQRETPDPTAAAGAAALIPRPWRLPLLAAVLTLAGVVLVFALVLPRFSRRPPPAPPPSSDPEEIHSHLRLGQKALAEGSFQLALRELSAAQALLAQQPDALPAADSRRLQQLEREAALLAALLNNSLQEILHQAANVRQEQEWWAQFRENYRGRAVIFDDVVRREPDGRCYLTVYEVRQGETAVRLELGELTLLQALPLDRPHRLLFGARLASIQREPPGVWVIRFRPDSGILLTEEAAAAACSPLPLDEELRQVIQQQREWADVLP
jgi:hypothetical protein